MKSGPSAAQASSASTTTVSSNLEKKSTGRWRRLLTEPLVHFFTVGALVFFAYWLQDTEPAALDDQHIEISANDVRQIIVAWLAQGRSPLTQAQLQSLIDQKVSEEVLFREGLALGLDRNDEIIKRRVAQKMDFLAADVAALQLPEKTQLLEWFSAHSERFLQPPQINFHQRYFSPDQRAGTARNDAVAALEEIADKTAGSAEVMAIGDAFMLRNYYSNASPDLLLKDFGPTFATELFKLEPGSWRGPIQSGYGWHLVFVESLEPPRLPDFDEIEAQVKAAWHNERYIEIKQTALDEMRSRYTIIVPALDTIDMSNMLGTRQEGVMPATAATQ